MNHVNKFESEIEPTTPTPNKVQYRLNRAVHAGLHILVGVAVSLLALGIGAIALDWIVSGQYRYLQAGLWLIAAGVVLCFFYLYLYTYHGD
jgi:nitrogen fixation-related uncharacterized protein